MSIFNFLFFGFFTGILGLIIGGPFRILVVENEIIESVILRLIFGFIFFPPVVGGIGLLVYYFFGENPELDSGSWGMITGLVLGMSCSYVMVGKSKPAESNET